MVRRTKGFLSKNKERPEKMRPVMFSLEYISYLLEHKFIAKGYLDISKDDVNILLKVYAIMISAVENEKQINHYEVPILDKI